MATGTSSDKREVEELRAEVSRLERRLEEQREELSRELVRRTYRIGELEEAVREKGRLYESTLSWRVTRPIRSVRYLLARLRRG